MKIDFRLRRKADADPATALLLLSHTAERLTRLLSGLRLDPLPIVYEVADGFLVKLPRPMTKALGGVQRLRSLADNVYLPVDAELVPALLTEESADFGRIRGIIFLPHGRALEYDPERPLPMSAMLTASQVRRDSWKEMPEIEPLADRITEITLEQPDITPEDLLESGGEEIGSEAPDLDDSSMSSKAMGKTAFGAGKAMAWLGKMLGMKGLAAAGKKWMESGLGMAPSLAESMFGKQEAMLRALLRAFREGKIEDALRRALPLDKAGRGGTFAGDAQLPTHNLSYSLQNILGGSGGEGSMWFTDINLYQELSREYRKQAELATQRGDHRRAAFIYGKLLSDYRAAAAVLSQGGLHRDAAVIYLKRLDDVLAAAREYEAAGESDRALELYRRRHDHMLAAELLRRIGEEEEAQAEYRLAADQLVQNGKGYYEAGEMLRTRARLENIATEYYQAGWAQRPAGSPVARALRLAQGFARDSASGELLTLAAQADKYLASPGNDLQAAEFYNELAQLAGKFPQEVIQDDLRDLALTGIATKLRQHVGSGSGAGGPTATILGASQVWPPPVVSDAQFALRRESKRTRAKVTTPTGSTVVQLRARIQSVTAVCHAAESGDVFVGFESGEIVCFRPRSGEVSDVGNEGVPILSLVASDSATAAFLLAKSHGEATVFLKTVTHNLGARTMTALQVREDGDAQFCQGIAGAATHPTLGVFTGTAIEFFQGPTLVPLSHMVLQAEDANPEAMLLLPSKSPREVALLGLYSHKFVYWLDALRPSSSDASGGGWRPDAPKGCHLHQPVLSRFDKGPQGLELAGVGTEGHLYHTDVQVGDGKFAQAVTKALSGPLPFLAAAVVRPGLVVGITRNGAQWLRRSNTGFVPVGQTDVSLPSAIACFPYHRGKEVIVVCDNGTVARVPAAF